MEAAILRYLKFVREEQGAAENTYLAYKSDLEQLRQVLLGLAGENIDARSISKSLMDGYVRWLWDQGYVPTTISRKIAAVRSFLSHLEMNEGLRRPGVLAVLQPPQAERRPPRTLSRNEIDRLLRTPGQEGRPRDLRDGAILFLLYGTGLLPAEVSGLRVFDVRLGRAELQLMGDNPRAVELGIARRPVKQYLEIGRPRMSRGPDQQALFLNLRGESLSRQGVWLVVKRWARRLNLGEGISPRTLRNSRIAHLLEDGISRRHIQRRMGLQSGSTLRVYEVQDSIQGA